jgi:hypothetical protein
LRTPTETLQERQALLLKLLYTLPIYIHCAANVRRFRSLVFVSLADFLHKKTPF